MKRALLALGVVGCESESAVIADMERALGESNDGLVGALVAAEILTASVSVPDTTLRHDSTENCGCPCIERINDNPPYLITLDYRDTGCVTDSGLLPVAVGGHVYTDFDGSVVGQTTWDSFRLALAHDVSGTFGGSVSGAAGAFELKPVGDLTVNGAVLSFDFTLAIDADGVTIEGASRVSGSTPQFEDEREVRFTYVYLPFSANGPPCPRPSAGTATLAHPSNAARDSVVDFAAPGDGFVTVTRDERASEGTDYCAYASDMW